MTDCMPNLDVKQRYELAWPVKTLPNVIVAAGLFGALVIPAPPAEALELRLNIIDSHIPSFPIKRQMNRAYRGELNEIHASMLARQEAGENLACSAQIFQEVHWLVNYTDRVADIERLMENLRESLENPDQAFAAEQDPSDGSFGACFESWIWRFHASVDPLKELAKRGETPKHPLKIWEPVDTPEKIVALFEDLLISEPDGRHNKRKELNLAVTALGQLLWLDYTATVFPDHLDRKQLGDALIEFVDERWQDPETGYWGAWYRDGNEIRKTNDLSISFHIISYRSGNVNHLQQIGQTTFAIRHVRYPFGWSSGGTQNNHHAYDVARIVNLTWDHLDQMQRATARALLFLMAARSLHLSIDSNGEFDAEPYSTVGQAYYFGVSFFDEIGLFRPSGRDEFLTISNTESLRERIEANLKKLDPSDPMVGAAVRKLNGE